MIGAPESNYELIFERVSDLLQRKVGHGLFTVSRALPGGHEVERIFTTNSAVYPVHGRKPVDQTDWTRMMQRGECFVANRPEDFGEHFFDLSTIVALGLGAVINVPVQHENRLLGTLNLLDKPGAYPHSAVDACLEARELSVQGYLAYERLTANQSV